MSGVIVTFEKILEVEVAEFVSASREIGGLVSRMADLVEEAFRIEMEYIRPGVLMEKPDDVNLNNLQQPLQSVLRRIQDFREENRSDLQFGNHLATIAESILALSWITLPAAPTQFIRDMKEAGDYFGNRVLNANKRDPRHSDWINKWHSTLSALESYVKRFHLTGFAWNSARPDIGGGRGRFSLPHPPPPPPPPPFQLAVEPIVGDIGPVVAHGTVDRQALMREINQGVGITQRLRPVQRPVAGEHAPVGTNPEQPVAHSSASQPGAHSSAAQPVAHSSSAQPVAHSSASRPVAQRTYPPKFALEGRKWRVEYYKSNHGLELHPGHHSESLAMYKCDDVILTNRGKVNGVTIDNCKKCVITLMDIIASVDLIRCERVTIQCMGTVPLISIDNCDSIQVALGENAMRAEVVHSKSTTINICILKDDGDYVELPLPEQFKSVVEGGRLRSTVIHKI